MDTDGDERTASERVLAAVAERMGVEKWELTVPLYETVDPEALDALFRGTAGHVTFEYMRFVVTVNANGDVHLDERSR